jgi:hypothetical protein
MEQEIRIINSRKRGNWILISCSINTLEKEDEKFIRKRE